jgi:hypothetical protein
MKKTVHNNINRLSFLFFLFSNFLNIHCQDTIIHDRIYDKNIKMIADVYGCEQFFSLLVILITKIKPG